MKLVIFDLDGVLVDACEWHRIALNEALNEVCGYKISEEDHYSTFNGIPTRVKLNKLSDMGIVKPEDHVSVYELKQEKTIEIISKMANVRQEKIDLMDYLISEGYHVACFTNSIRKTAILMLSATGIIDKFEVVLTNQDVKNPKPDPEGYNKLMSDYSISPDDCVIVEDSPKGIAAAVASGAHVMRVSSPEEVNVKSVSSFIEVLLKSKKTRSSDEDFNSDGRSR